MGIHVTLLAKGLFRDQELLGVKGRLPLGWFLAFESSLRTSKGAELARSRASKIVAGPRLRIALDGFVALLEKHRGRVYIDSELQDAELFEERYGAAKRFFADLDVEELGEHSLEYGDDGVLELEPGCYATELFGYGDYEWLYPQTEEDEEQEAAVQRAFAGVSFEYQISAANDGWTIKAGGHSFQGHIDSEEKLTVWAAHLSRHLSILGRGTGRPWTQAPNARAFWSAMEPFEPDRKALAERTRKRFIEAFANQRPSFTIDIGELGHLHVERVGPPEWTNHLHAELRAGPGDASWRAPLPEYFVPYHEQEAIFESTLRSMVAESRSATGASFGALELFSNILVPDRFDDQFVPAQRLSTEESPASIVFQGNAILVLSAAGQRVSFKLSLPPIDRALPIVVSGWRIAPSGDRFATVLRIGTRRWQFDSAGVLYEAR